MIFAVMIFGVLLLAVGAAALVMFAGYRFYDLLVLCFLATVATFLSRFNYYFAVELSGRPYIGFHWYLMGTFVLLVAARGLVHHQPKLRISALVLMVGAFAVLSLMSGLFNGGQAGLFAALQVLVISLAPILVAALLVDLAPRSEVVSHRLRLTFILLLGVLIPCITIASSIAPNTIGSFLGWSTLSASRETGFIRGWSPLGSAGSTGLVMVLAYGLAMHEVIGNRKRIYLIVLFLVGVAVLFMLARAVLVMLLLFHLIYFASAMRRQPGRVLGVALVCLVVGLPLFVKLQERYSFDRFGLLGGASDEIRSSSALAALTASVKNPLLGQGPGLLYEEIRTDWLMPTMVNLGPAKKVTVVENRTSAMEPHNVYLLLAAEHGWPAAILFCALMWVIWRRIRFGRHFPNLSDRSLSTALSASWLSALAMLLTASAPLVNPQTAVFFWFFGFLGVHWRATVPQILEISRPLTVPQPVESTGRILQPAMARY